MATLQPKPFVRDPFAKRRKPVKDPALLAAFADSHYWCQACGRYGDCTIHHIIGGRGGRSDEACNLLYCCARPCHLDYADHSRNLGVVLSMKLRAGELTEADIDRLQELHGKRLQDLEPIPEPFASKYRMNQLQRLGGAA